MFNPRTLAYLAVPALCAVTVLAQDASPMFAAVKGRDIAKVRAAVEANPSSVNATNDTGWTPLHYAAAVGDKDILDFLVSKGANVNARTKDTLGATPLMMAAFTGRRIAAELLIASGADVDATALDNGATALGIAAQQGHQDVVDLLLGKATSVRYQAQLNNTLQSVSFDAQGRRQVSLFSVASGSTIESACGKGAFVQAKVESGHVVDGKAVLRVPAGQMVYTTKGSLDSFVKMKTEDGFTLVGTNEAQLSRSTAEITMSGQCATVTGLSGVRGGTAGFYIVVDPDGGRFDVASGIGLGGRFRFRND